MMPPLPTHAVPTPWLWLVVLLPLAGLVRLRHAAAAGLAGALMTAVGAIAVALLRSPDSTVATARWLVIDGHGLRLESSLSATPIGLALCVFACAAWIVVDRRPVSESRSTSSALIRSAALLGLLAGDHLTFVVAILVMGWQTGSARLQAAGWSWLVGAAALAWGLGSSGWSERGDLRLSAGLGMHEGAEAIRIITAARLPPAPIGIDEAMARGDHTGESARWIVPGPSFDVIDTTDQLRVPSSGQRLRLSRMRLQGIPVRGVVTAAWILAALLAALGVFALARTSQDPLSALLAMPLALAIFRSGIVLEPVPSALALTASIAGITLFDPRRLVPSRPAPRPLGPRSLAGALLLVAMPLVARAMCPSWFGHAGALASLAAGAWALRTSSPWALLVSIFGLQVSAISTSTHAGLAAAVALGIAGLIVAVGAWLDRPLAALGLLAPAVAFAVSIVFAASVWACLASVTGLALSSGAFAGLGRPSPPEPG